MNKKIITTLLIAFLAGFSFSATAMAGPIPDTGQTQSYTSTWGEDSDYTINPPSYTDLGNGSVQDNVTGLIWDKTTYSGLQWPAVQGIINRLNESGHAGCQNWRVPTVKELAMLVDSSMVYPSINMTYFPDTLTSTYWSSTPATLFDSTAMWGVNFGDGIVFAYCKSDYNALRPVCGCEGYFNNSFSVNQNGTVCDTNSGLEWQQGSALIKKTWEQALQYCEGLTLADRNDWRLPNRNELQSLVDYSKFNPSIDSTVFSSPGQSPNPKETVYDYWSSTTFVGQTSSAWYVDFTYGYVKYANKNYPAKVRCVRECELSNTTTCVSSTTTTIPPTTTTTEPTTTIPTTTTTAPTTAIELSSFTVTPKNSAIILEWTTESEIDNAGFNLLRAASENGPYAKINATLIAAEGSSTQGAAYEFIDSSVQNRKTYFYKLEDIDLNGSSTTHGPVSATPRLILGIANK